MGVGTRQGREACGEEMTEGSKLASQALESESMARVRTAASRKHLSLAFISMRAPVGEVEVEVSVADERSQNLLDRIFPENQIKQRRKQALSR